MHNDSLLVPHGACITKVNGIDIDRYMATWNRQGTRDIRWDLRRRKYYCYNIFDPRVTGAGDKFVLTYKYNGKKFTKDISSYKKKFITAARSYPDEAYQPAVRFLKRDRLLYIRLPQMQSKNQDTICTELARYRNYKFDKIVLDVRSNPGGNDEVWRNVLAMIIDKPIEYSFMIGKKRSPYFRPSQEKLLIIGKDTLYTTVGTTRIEPSIGTLNYEGKIYVLVDPFVYSSTGGLLSDCMKTDRLISVGTPGAIFGGRGATPLTEILPNSKIIFRWSHTIEVGNVRKEHVEAYRHDQVEIPVYPTYQEYKTLDSYQGMMYSEDFLYTADPVFRKVLSL